MSDANAALEGFDGRARLFPLPNLVFFPRVMQPLHIFEPRYRQMTADALAGDRRIALVLPRPGWEADYAGKPAIHAVACLGRIVAEQELEDGRYNLLLRGECRVRVGDDLPHDGLYRLARTEPLADRPPADLARAAAYRRRLAELAPPLFPHPGPVRDEFVKLLQGPLTVATMADLVAFSLPLPSSFKQELLEELDVERRARRLVEHLEAQAGGADKAQAFPPPFSVN